MQCRYSVAAQYLPQSRMEYCVHSLSEVLSTKPGSAEILTVKLVQDTLLWLNPSPRPVHQVAQVAVVGPVVKNCVPEEKDEVYIFTL